MARLENTLLVVTALVAGCGNHGNPEPATVGAIEAFGGTAQPRKRPRHVYYDLSQYAWYGRAQPLIHEQTRYEQHGVPEHIALAKLRLAGNYQGVDFYALHSDEEPPATVYVPVFEGYWLPFARVGPASD